MQATPQQQQQQRRLSPQAKHNHAKRAWLVGLKVSRGCQMCGARPEDPRALHWHHLFPSEKAFDISKSTHSKSKKALSAEIAKCIVACEACHEQTETFGGRGR